MVIQPISEAATDILMSEMASTASVILPIHCSSCGGLGLQVETDEVKPATALRKQEQAAKAFAKKVDQHARKVSADIDRESKKNGQRIVKLEKRITDIERRLRKTK